MHFSANKTHSIELFNRTNINKNPITDEDYGKCYECNKSAENEFYRASLIEAVEKAESGEK